MTIALASRPHHTQHETGGSDSVIVTELVSLLKITSVITPAQITANQNDYSPTGLATSVQLRLSSDAARTITGFALGSEGRILFIVNVGSFNITLANESASSIATNRMITKADLILTPNDFAIFRYDNVSQRWRVISTNIVTTSGEANTASMVGTGLGKVWKDKVGVDLRFRSLLAGANVTITNGTDDVTIATSTGVGEANTASMVGTGLGKIFKQKSVLDLQFKSILAGSGIIVTNGTDDVTIATSGGGGGGAIQLLNKTTTDLAITNSITETSFYSFLIPANYLSNHGVIRGIVRFLYLNNSTAVSSIRLIIKFGTSTLFNRNIGTISTSSSYRVGRLNFEIFPDNNNSPSVEQFFAGDWYLSDAGGADIGLGDPNDDEIASHSPFGGVSAETVTTDKLLDVRIELDDQHSNISIIRKLGMLEYIP
jgi:hypothetical protein